MNDERFQHTVGAWLRDEDPAAPDSLQSARQVAARLPLVRQQSRWWPLPLLRRTPAPARATDTIAYQPIPIPATNGHTPTVIGRTQSMLSPAKAITAGAIVFAIGGAFLIAQPFGQQGSLPGATTDDEPVAPVEFTGRWAFGDQRLSESSDTSDPRFVRSEGGAWSHAADGVTDPRFDGEVTIFANSDDYASSTGNFVYHDAWRVENADGAWQSEPSYNLGFADGSGTGLVAVFHGEGGYEGLVAVVGLDGDDAGWDLRGVIFDGDLPPAPEAQHLP